MGIIKNIWMGPLLKLILKSPDPKNIIFLIVYLFEVLFLYTKKTE